MKRPIFVAVVSTLTASASAQSSGLFLYELAGPRNFNTVYEVDETRPGVFNQLVLEIFEFIADFEYDGTDFWAPSAATNTELFRVSGANGARLDRINMTFPAGGNVLTSLEFVGGTLYGGFTSEGGGASSLVTINTTTGLVSLVGAMGINTPTGGLAYRGGALYTVNSGAGGAATLYTVDIASGLASPIGPVTDQNGNAVTLTGLEFGLDGVLYGLGRAADQNTLFTIDPASGSAVRLGVMPGLVTSSALAAVPAPASLALLGLGLLSARRRR